MTLKSEAMSALLSKLAVGVTTAATLAGATAIISTARTQAVHEVRITNVERTVEKIDTLNDTLEETSKEVALLRQELEHRHEPSN